MTDTITKMIRTINDMLRDDDISDRQADALTTMLDDLRELEGQIEDHIEAIQEKAQNDIDAATEVAFGVLFDLQPIFVRIDSDARCSLNDQLAARDALDALRNNGYY